MSKEKILEDFDVDVMRHIVMRHANMDECNKSIYQVKNFISKAINQTREETKKEIIETIKKLKSDLKFDGDSEEQGYVVHYNNTLDEVIRYIK